MMYKNFEYVVDCLENDHTMGKKVQFDEKLKKQFGEDLLRLVSDMQKSYPENVTALVQEQKTFFQKFELIAKRCPELLKQDFFCDWIAEILSTGLLPNPVCYVEAGVIKIEAMVVSVPLYLKEKSVQIWTLEHWDHCRIFASVIYNTLKRQNIDAPMLCKISNTHHGRKLFIGLVLLIVVVILGLEDYVSSSVFLLLLILVITFNELVFLWYRSYFSVNKKKQ